jgi:hypothetical protein
MTICRPAPEQTKNSGENFSESDTSTAIRVVNDTRADPRPESTSGIRTDHSA